MPRPLPLHVDAQMMEQLLEPGESEAITTRAREAAYNRAVAPATGLSRSDSTIGSSLPQPLTREAVRQAEQSLPETPESITAHLEAYRIPGSAGIMGNDSAFARAIRGGTREYSGTPITEPIPYAAPSDTQRINVAPNEPFDLYEDPNDPFRRNPVNTSRAASACTDVGRTLREFLNRRPSSPHAALLSGHVFREFRQAIPATDPFSPVYQYYCRDCNTWLNETEVLNDCNCSPVHSTVQIRGGGRRSRGNHSNIPQVTPTPVKPNWPIIPVNCPMDKQAAKKTIKSVLSNFPLTKVDFENLMYSLSRVVDEIDYTSYQEPSEEVTKVNALNCIENLKVPVSVAKWSQKVPKDLLAKLSFHDLNRLKDSFILTQKQLVEASSA